MATCKLYYFSMNNTRQTMLQYQPLFHSEIVQFRCVVMVCSFANDNILVFFIDRGRAISALASNQISRSKGPTMTGGRCGACESVTVVDGKRHTGALLRRLQPHVLCASRKINVHTEMSKVYYIQCSFIYIIQGYSRPISM